MQTDFWPFEASVREVAALLARGEYVTLERLTGGVRLTAAEMRAAVAAYPARLLVPPSANEPSLEVVAVVGEPWVSQQWAVRVPLWTVEEGRSDLEMRLTVREDSTSADGYAIEIDGILVP